jgi:hypothetical protein
LYTTLTLPEVIYLPEAISNDLNLHMPIAINRSLLDEYLASGRFSTGSVKAILKMLRTGY